MQSAPIKIFVIVCVTLFTFAIPNANGSNILGLFLSHSQSHLIVHMSVAKTLAERGHNVTVISTRKPVVTHKNIHNILIPPTAEHEIALAEEVSSFAAGNRSILSMNIFSSILITMQFDILRDERFTKLYENTDTKFDLIIMGYFMNDFQLAVAPRFKAPVILNWMNEGNEIINQYVGNPRESAYVPNMATSGKVGDQMGFLTRVLNMVTNMIFIIFRGAMDWFAESFYLQLTPPNDSKFPSYHEMKKNVSLVFVNSHFSEGPIRPNVPAHIEIGGIQIKDKPDALPEDIAQFLNNSNQHGAILFSLGSNIKISQMKPETVKSLYKTLSSLKQNVIWKWEDMVKTPGNAPNILYKNWLPQDDILAHPNLKLFITHSGKGGQAEALYHGVPMVALPAFADQHSNAELMESSGYGLQLDLNKFTENAFKIAVLEVLTNLVYANNVEKFSQLYRDRPLTARETVIFWSEYVIRHHGAAHIQSPVVHMNAIQSYSLDVMALLCVVLYFALKLLKIIYKFTFKVLLTKLGWCKNTHSKVKSQ